MTVNLARVAITKTTSNVTIDNYNPYAYDPNFTYLLTGSEYANLTQGIHQWTQSQLLSGISAGLLQTTTSTQINIEAPNITAKNIVITTHSGPSANSGNIGSIVNPVTDFSATANVIGFAPGSNINGSQVQIALAAAQSSEVNFLAAIPLDTSVNFSGNTITLTDGSSWDTNVYKDNEYLYIGGSTQNATQNGAYLKITDVTGSVITVSQSLQTEQGQQILIAPVVLNLNTTDQSVLGTVAAGVVTPATPTPTHGVNFGDVSNNGTITLTNGSTWTALGYKVGQGIFVGSSTTPADPNSNGATFSASGTNPYYTIAAISIDGATLTLQWGQILTPETGATVNLAPVAINLVSGATSVKFVLVSQSRDVAITPLGTVNATADGFIFLGSQDNLELDHIVSTTNGNVEIKTQGFVTNVATSGVNVQGSEIILEAGGGAIGTDQIDGTDVNAVTVQIGTGGSLTARAKYNIYITAPTSDIPVGGIFSQNGGVDLIADTGSIYDFITSDFAKIQANWLELQALNGSVGVGSTAGTVGVMQGSSATGAANAIIHPALHVNIISTDFGTGDDTSGTLRVIAKNNIDIDQTNGDLYVLDALSTMGDVMLEAAGNILNGGNLTTPTALGSVVLATFGAANVYGENIFLNAGTGGPGGIGKGSSPTSATSAPFNIVSSYSHGNDSGVVTALAGDQPIFLEEVGSTISSTNGDILLNMISAGAGATAFITSAGGSILNGRTDTNPVAIAGMADLIAMNSVGSQTARNGAATGRIVSALNNIQADSTTGSIWLWNKGALNVGGVVAVDPNAANPDHYAMWAPLGSINIETSSPLEISQSNLSQGPIIEQAGNSTDTGVNITNSNLTVDAGVILQSQTSYIELDAGNNIVLDGSSTTNGVFKAGALLESATYVVLNAGYLDTTAPSAPGGSIDSVTLNAGSTINAGTTLTINAGNNVTVDGPSSGNAAAALTAGTSITIQAGYLSTPGTFDTDDVSVDLFGSFTAPLFNVTTGDGDDNVLFSPSAMAIAGATTIDTGAGDDTITVENLPNMTSLATINANAGQIADTINLDGQDGADNVIVNATVNTNYVINVNDTGALDSGLNTLTVNGAVTTSGQTFLLREFFVAVLESNGNPVYQRINYNDTMTGGLEINGGNVDVDPNGTNPNVYGDSYYLDGNSAVTTINAGNGDDFFQVGQVYGVSSVGLLPGEVGAGIGDELTTTVTTVGRLSDGVNKSTVLYGGSGTDTFEVYSNKADLAMIGGSGDDTFIVRAFLVAAGTHIGVTGGSGNDTIEYNINAPVDIEGGTGFNTLVLLGTEANDTFVITSTGIFGGGLNIAYTNIQAITIDGLEGNDTFYVLSTPYDVVTTINGGDGGDTIDVGGDVTGAVISANTKGASSVTDNSVTSLDPNYNNTFVAGVSVLVGGSGGAIIEQPTQAIVHVNDPNSITYMKVSAPTGLATNAVAYVNVTPTLPSAEWGSQEAASLLVSIDGGVTWAASAILTFVGGQTATQTVLMKAAPTDGTYTRNETIVVTSSIISTDDPTLNGLVLPTVKVILETGTAGLIIDQGLRSTSVVDGKPVVTYDPQPTTIVAGQTTYTYYLSYNQQIPNGGQPVTFNLSAVDGQGAVNSQIHLSQSSVTFDSTNWDTPVAITVSADSDPGELLQNVIIKQTTAVGNVDVGDVNITVAAQVAGVAVLAPPGAGEVSTTGGTYSYQYALTAQPTADVTVSILGDGQTYATSTAAGFNSPVFNPTGPHPYYKIAGINGNVITLAAGTVLTNETGVTVSLAAIAIDAQNSANDTAGSYSLVPVTFSYDSHGVATVTLATGTWADLGITDPATQGLFVGSTTDANSNNYQTIIFTPQDWNIPVTVTLHAIPGGGSSSGDGSQASNPQTDMSFPNQPHTLAQMYGSLIIDGGTQPGQPKLVSAVGLPYETANIAITEQDLQGEGVGEGAIDVVNIYDDGAVSGQTGTLTTITSADEFGQPILGEDVSGYGVNISGLDMPTQFTSPGKDGISFTNANTHITTTYENGIDIVNVDAVQLFLGKYNDNFTIDTTHPTLNADDGLQTTMVIEGGGGSNTITVTASSDPLVLYGNDSASGVEYNSLPGAITGNAYSFTSSGSMVDPYGSDIINASGATGTVVIVGGPDNDTLTGGSGINWIAGGEGDDLISASGAQNYIFGDSSFTVGELVASAIGNSQSLNLSSRLLTIDNSLLQMDRFVNGGVQSAGADTITVTGNGASYVFGDYGIIDIANQATPGVVDPFSTLGHEVFTEMASVNTALGGDDIINVNNVNSSDVVIGGAGNDRIILGSGGQNVVLGDNGEIDYTNSGQILSGILMDVSFGNTGAGQTAAGTITLTNGGNWASLGYAVGGGIYVGSSDTNHNGSGTLFSAGATKPYYTIASIDGSTLTLVAGQTLTAEANATVSLSPVAISGTNGSTSTLGGVPTLVSFSTNTITQIDGESWAALGYAVGEGIFVGSPTNSNTNGTVFNPTQVNPKPYYTITAINGAVLTVQEVLTVENLATVNLSPVTISGTNGSTSTLTGVSTQVKSLTSIMSIDPAHGGNDIISGAWAESTPVATQVTFGNNSGNTAGTITLATGTWQASGYAVGDGIYVQGTGVNGNGATFTGSNYYTIAAINGATVTLKIGQTLTATGVLTENLALFGPTPAGAGNNIVIGGVGADTIDVGGTNNTVMGDDGQATYNGATGKLTSISTTDPTVGGNDFINVTGGGNAILGGFGADQINVGGPNNTILGDNGSATFDPANGLITFITTFTGLAADVPSQGGNDFINVSSGSNVIIGGAGADTITIGGSGNVVLGDDGFAYFNDDVLANSPSLGVAIETTDQTVGGNDAITVNGNGNNVIFGGSGADTITVNGSGSNVIFGDNGAASYTNGGILTEVATVGETAPAEVFGNTVFASSESNNSGVVYGGNDVIQVGDGNNEIVGGFGADTITTGNGRNVVLGDSGYAVFDPSTNALVTIASDPVTFASGAPQLDLVLGSANLGTSSSDIITLGNGNNVVIGGADADTIVVGSTGANVIIGDDGEADYTNGVLTSIFSTDGALNGAPFIGGNDSITGPTINGTPSFGGNGNNVVIGGIGADIIKLGGANNTVIGDDGKATFGTSGQILTITTQDPTIGGNDTITVNGGNNEIFGGTGADTITATGASSGNVIVGDDGDATFTSEPVSNTVATSVLSFIETVSQTDGNNASGDDTISTGDGNNVILGGSGADQITVGNGNSVIMGDNGNATFAIALATGTVAAGTATYSRTLTNIETTAEAIVSGVLTQTTDQTINAVVYGGDDTIITGNGNNVIFGGLGADQITTGDGGSVILGDSGTANFDSISGALVSIVSTFVGAPVGGAVATGTSSNDIIKAGIDNVGDGNNVVFGGDGADQITTGSGTDIILGDNGYADFAVVAGLLTPQHVHSTNSTIGGNDVISSGAGNDIVFGETGDDTIDGGAGSDTLFGDFASYDSSLPANARVLSIFTGISDGGGNDTIYGNTGNNFIVGGQGNDTLYGDEPLGNPLNAQAGDNDIIGDNNTPGGAVGNDFIYAYGAGNDVILGDNGQIFRQVLVDNWQNMVWAANPAPFGDLVRQVTTYDELLGGADTIVGGDGIDRIFGQAGNDTITDGNGSDEVIGGLGSNNITVGSGDDTVLAGEGQIFRALNPDGTPALNSDGSWHRDVLLEQVGAITGSVGIDSAGNAIQPNLAAQLLDADLVLLAGSFQSNGSPLINSNDSAWQAEALLVALEPVTGSTVTAGSGDDVIFGTLGNDTITAGNGNDVIFGDRASNTVTYATDIPHIINGVLIVGDTSSIAFNIPSNGQGDLVTPAVNLLPSALTPNAPQIELGPSTGAGSLQSMVQNGNLVETNGTVVQVFASIVPDLIHNKDALPGNDTITVGNGNDVIFGDYGVIGALPTTGISAIDAQLQGLSVTMLGLLNQFSALSTAQDALEIANHTSTTPFTISAGNDHITVGNGNDTVFGDEGEYLVPGVAFAQASGSLANNAVALDSYLLNMQEVFGDMSYVVNDAGQQIISSYSAPASRPATHLLNLGNDVISDGSGTDIVIGDNGIVVMPGVGTPTSNWASGVSAATLQSVQAQLVQVETTFNLALKAQFTADHPFTANNSAAAQNLFNGGAGFDLYIGNDQISGGAGNSILVGDDALILDPVIASGSNGANDAAALQELMVTAVDRLFLGSYSSAAATSESWGVVANLAASGAPNGSSAGGYVFNDPSKSNITIDSDTISAGAGSDHIYGDMSVILPVLGSTPGAATGFYAFPIGETGETNTANFNYAYGFGPFGSLQQWAAPPNAPSHYTVDADTITGGAGNNVIFGELGDDSITGGAGNDEISGGYGFNTVGGGGGTNQVIFNRSTDTYVAGGGNDIARSSLDTTAASTILQVTSQSIIGNTIAAGEMTVAPGPVTWTGIMNAATTYPAQPGVIVIESHGSTSLVEVAGDYYLENSGGSGPELKYNGALVTAGQTGTWTPIGAEQTSTGYEVAWKVAGADQYMIWTTRDSNGNYISNVQGNGVAIESYETSFQQDLNGDGVVGVPTAQAPLNGLVQLGGDYYLGSSAGPDLKYNGALVTAGQTGMWTPIGATQTSTGYEVAWKAAGADQYMIWTTDSNGNYLSNAQGNGAWVESYETTFNQDLNGDGTVGVPPVTGTVIESSGSTSLTVVGNDYYLVSNSTATGPDLKYNGGLVTVGQTGVWTPIAAEQTSTGYEVAWKVAGTNQYLIWTTDSNGNYIGNVQGNGVAIESYEASFQQDLNGDGFIGTVIESSGSTALVQFGNNYNLDSSSTGTGPDLKYNGGLVTAGQTGTWTPIAAEQTSTGYEVAWKVAGANQYMIWTTDSSGNYLSNVQGNGAAIASYEASFYQDLNGDGVIGTSSTVIEATGNVTLALNPLTQAASIGTGASQELTGAVTTGLGHLHGCDRDVDPRPLVDLRRPGNWPDWQRCPGEFRRHRPQGRLVLIGNEVLFRQLGRRHSDGERYPRSYREHLACRRLHALDLHAVQRWAQWNVRGRPARWAGAYGLTRLRQRGLD